MTPAPSLKSAAYLHIRLSWKLHLLSPCIDWTCSYRCSDSSGLATILTAKETLC